MKTEESCASRILAMPLSYNPNKVVENCLLWTSEFRTPSMVETIILKPGNHVLDADERKQLVYS